MKTGSPRAHFKYDLALIFVTFIWGTTFVIAKELVNQTPPLNYLSARFLVAALVLSLLLRKVWRRLDRVAIKGGITLGVLLYGGFLAQAIGLTYTTPAKTAFVTGVTIILVPFFSYFLSRARITPEHLIAVMLAVIGFGLLTVPKANEKMNIGDLSSLVGTIFWALHIVNTGIWTQRVETRKLLLLQIVCSACCFIISLIVLQTLGWLPVLASRHWPVNIKAGGELLYLSTVATIITIFVQTRVQRHIAATRAAIIFSLEPAFAAFVSYLVLGELLSWRAYLGGALIIVAIIISELKLFARADEKARSDHLTS